MPYKNKQKEKEYKTRWNKEYYRTHKEQEKKRTSERKKILRKWFKAHKETLKCEKCGENHYVCIEFHHKNKNDKTAGVSVFVHTNFCSKDKILAEIEKCTVLCANCHRKVHFK